MSFSSKVKREIENKIEVGECENRAFLRASYLFGGTMAHPNKAYHLEFAIDYSQKQKLLEAFEFFGLNPKEHLRKSGEVLYFKEAEQISAILRIIGAHVALMEFENCRVDKDVNNSINRVANAAAANEDKVIAASARHVKDIMDIQRLVGLSVLPNNLAEVAKIRLENPLAGLEDIGRQLTPPISKSGVNHRLNKIGKIAEKYRGDGHVQLS
ncbi:MAG: DNA-binding protein WhiA [Clostridiales bacterium]|jgi:DNA-binding protein WhiA|nr:DNA-binding protein WhiA [Clostridiales bacterium]